MKAQHLLQLVALSALWGSSFMLTRVAAPVMHATAFVMLLPGAVLDWPTTRFTAPALASSSTAARTTP